MDNCLYATNNTYLNDKSEGWHVFDALEDNMDFFFSGQKKEFVNNIRNEIDIIRKKTNDPDWFDSFVVSFSLNRDSLGMWNYYTKGNDFLGYNIEFDVYKLRKSIKIINSDTKEPYSSINVNDGKVIYKLDDQKELISKTIKSFDSVNIIDRPYYIVRKLWEQGRFIKKNCFEYENEYRFLFSFVHDYEGINTPSKDEYRVVKGLMIPFQKTYFDKLALTGITCSPSLESEKAMQGVEYMLQLFGYDENVYNNIVMSEIPVRY